uniref:Gag protein n=1 Tax=Mycena chlorophos TaxID=658473 RepID=A0ABQ0M831_MYCCL|nr:gag protein [Mycena chlorophos]
MRKKDLLAISQRYALLAAQIEDDSDGELESESHEGTQSSTDAQSGNPPAKSVSVASAVTDSVKVTTPQGADGDSSIALISLDSPAVAGPSQNKGKGVDPRNWGDTSLKDWSEADLNAQRDAFANFEEIRRIIKQESVSTPPDFFKEMREPSADAPQHAASPVIRLTRVSPAPSPVVNGDGVPAQSPSAHEGPVSGQTTSEDVAAVRAEMQQHIARLEQELREAQKPASTLERAKARKILDNYVEGLAQENPKRMSSRRSSGPRSKEQKMRIKPKEPNSYDGSPNATAFHRLVRESAAYVDLGSIPAQKQVFYISYFLKGPAADFYNQVVVPKEKEYTLVRFFEELFEFCFPIDYRTKQRKLLDRCYQGSRTVAAHVAHFSEIYNTIGIVDSQEKVVKLWNSLDEEIQQEMHREKLDPESSSWDEIVKAAMDAEIVVNLGHLKRQRHGGGGSGSNSNSAGTTRFNQSGSNSNTGLRRTRFQFRRRGNGGRVSGPSRNGLHTASVDVPKKTPGAEKQFSAQRRQELLAKDLCFNCEEPGHLARNCPKRTTVTSKRKGKPPGIGVRATRFNDESHTLYEASDVLESMQAAAILFGGSDVEVEEGGGSPVFPDTEIDSEHRYRTPRPIGDIISLYSKFALELAQPFPGELLAQPDRFLVYRISDSEYCIMDNVTGLDTEVLASDLADPGFMLSHWYALQRCQALELDSSRASDERFCIEMSDALANTVGIILDNAHDSEGRFRVREEDTELLLVQDRGWNMAALLPKEELFDETFDLYAWFEASAQSRDDIESSEDGDALGK